MGMAMMHKIYPQHLSILRCDFSQKRLTIGQAYAILKLQEKISCKMITERGNFYEKNEKSDSDCCHRGNGISNGCIAGGGNV